MIAAGYRVSHHAQGRMREFGLSAAEVATVIDDYENRYEQTYQGRKGQWVHQRGSWAVVTSQSTVVTVLRREHRRWEHR